MKHWSAELLEFDSLKQLLGRYVSTPLGRAELEKVAPGQDRAQIEETLAEVAEAMEYLKSASRPQAAARGAAVRIRFDSLPAPVEAIHKLHMEGAVLEPKEILEITQMLDRAGDARSLLTAVAGRFPKLAARAEKIGEFRPVVRDLIGKILPDGTVADHASAALARLRREIERQKRAVQESLERFLRTHREDDVVREDFITIRNERFVIPVIAGRQGKVEGVIHGSSGSGHTLFLEPFETIERNNELVRMSEEELREVHRILREMTDRLRAYEPAIERTASVLGEIELLFAKGAFGVEFQCVIPRFGQVRDLPHLVLKEARHPLLEDVLRRQKKTVVPVSLSLDGGHRTLLISGPNTGGKTVSLKTTGLLALMALSGLPVPCSEAEFPMFDRVLADIGDNQSIQESLSTFSAHVGRIREMEQDVTPDSLVLLDELGRATDPEEGGALGVAILDRFRAAGAFTLASTHLLALKVYGATTEGVLNGSMGFDEETLEPTYVLRTGAPGKSAGLDIARRLGLPEALIERARAAMSSREQDISRFLSELHQRVDRAAELEQALQQQQAALAAREQSVAREWSQKESAKLKELERRCDLVLDKFETQAREVIENIGRDTGQKKASGQPLRQVAKAKRELREEIESTVLSTRDDARQGELERERPKIVEGARVRLKGVSQPARVLRVLGEVIEVEAGLMRMKVGRDDVLEVVPQGGETRKLPANVSFQPAEQWYPATREINLIGRRAEEACQEVEKFLDNAVVASVSRIRIIHGHGMGILRRAVAELLANNSNVEKFYPASQDEGGTGATIVELKE
jgi:DNA mismatch repair protein MutS2